MVIASGVLAALLVLLAVAAAVATRVPALERGVRVGAVAAEAVVVVFVVADLGLVLRGDGEGPDSLVTHLGYAAASAGLLPALVFRAPAPEDAEEEAEPASLWVVVVALLAVAICLVRLAQTR